MTTSDVPPVLALFGAGQGTGAALARRFGRDGYRVALVARRSGPLRELVSKLSAKGVDATAFPADLTAAGGPAAVVAAIRERLGRIDVAHFGALDGGGFIPARELTAEQVARNAELFLYAPIRLVTAVLPEMMERGSGSILVTHGASALQGVPSLSGPGPVMAASRNYLQSLHGEVGDQGVHVGTVAVGALIGGSAAHQQWTAANGSPPPFPVVEAGVLADAYANMVQERGPFERVFPE